MAGNRKTMILHVVLFVLGLAMLYYGAKWLVRGSADLAAAMGITPLVIGLTVVAFGTSAPELVISVVSSIKGKSMIAIGNVVGSNICNIALVLGLSAVLMPIACDRKVLVRDIPIMLGISIYLLLLSLNNHIGRLEGVTLFAGIIIYTLFNYFQSRQRRPAAAGMAAPTGGIAVQEKGGSPSAPFFHTRTGQICLIVAGIAFVITGADLLVDSAVVLMKRLGVSEIFIGLTIVALGTSLPELATSIVAVLKKEMDISIGNLVGSNVFNILSVVGATAMIRPIHISGGFVESGLLVDYLVMLGTSLLPVLLAWRGGVVRRSHGLLLLTSYAGYIGWLIIRQ
jgi:cation:H+ antiporter